MRNAYSLPLLAVAGCRAVVPAAARDEILYDSGNAFTRECSSMTKQTTEMTGAEINSNVKCAVYVKGVFDGIQAERTRVSVLDQTKVSTAFFCEDSFNDAENGQVVRILLKYIRDNPEKANQPVGALFMFAMREAFPPCPETK
jgi:hypothetical protein